MENNHVVVSGVIINEPVFSHECFGERFYKTEIMCTRSSGVADYLVLIISEKLITTDFTDLYVCVEGSLRTKNDNGHLRVVLFVEDIDIVDFEKSDVNEVSIIGYICKKNNIRKTPGGRTVIDFTVALNRNYGKSDYVPVICWGRNAAFIDELNIGAKISVIGRLQSREYTKNEKIHVTYEVSVQDVDLEQD